MRVDAGNRAKWCLPLIRPPTECRGKLVSPLSTRIVLEACLGGCVQTSKQWVQHSPWGIWGVPSHGICGEAPRGSSVLITVPSALWVAEESQKRRPRGCLPRAGRQMRSSTLWKSCAGSSWTRKRWLRNGRQSVATLSKPGHVQAGVFG